MEYRSSLGLPLAERVIAALLTAQMNVLVGARICQIAHLLQQQRILEDALNRFDEIRLQGAAVLLLGIACGEELLQGMVAFIWKCAGNAKMAKWRKLQMIERPNKEGGEGVM